MRTRGGTILLVDDSQDDVELTVQSLREQGIPNPIDIARDGEEALHYLFCRGRHAGRSFERAPHLVLLDLKLPKVDGAEVLRQVKQDARTQAIPVVILTGSGEEYDLLKSYHLGANGYIQKPVSFDEFRDAVRHAGLFWLVTNHPAPPSAYRAAAPLECGGVRSDLL